VFNISLYSCFLKPNDRFVLSKGHACIPYYLLLREQKYNPKISDHPDIDAANGICCSTGSLGHGLPIGVGMSLAKKIKNEPGKVYVLIGDGECQEGTVWESLMIAAHHKLNNLTVIIDNNQLQGSGRIEDILSLGDIKNKIESFGCYAIKVDGHSYRELIAAFEKKNKKPKVIIAETIKGKGISLMENNPVWHSRWPTLEQINMALQELT
jgi:transketolase